MSTSACTWIEREEIFERYVRDALADAEHDAFEAHYFECAACFDKIQLYEALQAELAALPAEVPASKPAPGWPWRWAFVPLAAGVVLLIAAALWFRSPAPAAPEYTVASAPATQQKVVEPPVGPTGPRSPGSSDLGNAPASTKKGPAHPPAPPVVALSVLARADPPLYVPVALRGARDEAAEAFDAAMRLYVGGDYAGAVPGLRTAAGLRPDAPQIAFFLAACRLLTGEVSAAASGFESVVALGDSPYLEEAHFYLAKVRISQGLLPAAREQLRKTIDCHGRFEPEARRLLTQLDALPAK
jgi:TolA-binding protein